MLKVEKESDLLNQLMKNDDIDAALEVKKNKKNKTHKGKVSLPERLYEEEATLCCFWSKNDATSASIDRETSGKQFRKPTNQMLRKKKFFFHPKALTGWKIEKNFTSLKHIHNWYETSQGSCVWLNRFAVVVLSFSIFKIFHPVNAFG